MLSHPVDWRREPPGACRGGAVAIGNFDGAHRGHAELVRELHRVAAAVGGPAVALTFDPHPRAILRPDLPLALLTTSVDREELLRRLGVDHPYEDEKAALLDAVATANRCETVWSPELAFSTVFGFESDVEAVDVEPGAPEIAVGALEPQSVVVERRDQLTAIVGERR